MTSKPNEKYFSYNSKFGLYSLNICFFLPINICKKINKQEAEKVEFDPFNGIRLHAWVAIIENAPWCYKPKIKKENSSNENTVFFIEPSTGFRFEVDNTNYHGIESVWNQHNYYVKYYKKKWEINKRIQIQFFFIPI